MRFPQTAPQRRIHVVSQSLAAYPLTSLPGGYICLNDHSTAPIHMRTALELVRDKKLIYRFRLPRHSVSPSPILATMQFAPWTCFSVARRHADISMGEDSRTTERNYKRDLGSMWFDYFCFSCAEDLALFKMAWN